MTKYQLRTKLKAIRMVKEEGWTCGRTAKELKLGKRTVHRWVEYYNEYGEAGLSIKPKNYNSEFRRQVVEYVLAHHISYSKAALHFKIPHDGIVGGWVKEHLQSNARDKSICVRKRDTTVKKQSHKHIPKDYSSLNKKEMLEELERLECENAYLKKLDALLQEKERSPKKIK